MLEVLPDEKGDFSSQSFWDGFFVEWSKTHAEAEEGFEWYGEWSDISPLVNLSREAQGLKRSQAECLVVGCGNSSLSKDMYDEGYRQVTSIDFSSVVIEDMKATYEDPQACPGLRFILMDMLAMPDAWAQRFHMVVDKGALDALFAEDTEEMREKARGMLVEITRVLAKGGMYMCVSLAQPYLLSFVLDHFTAAQGFSVSVSPFQPAESSSLCPFLLVFRKDVENAGLAFGELSGLSREQVEERVQEQRMVFEMRRRVTSSGEGAKGVVGKFTFADGAAPEKGPKYAVSVVESGLGKAEQQLRCGVFIVPQGREHEWMFANAQGQMQIAVGNGIGRLIVVSLCRGHSFESMEAIQKELSPRMLELAPVDMPKDQPFPFFGVGQDVGQRKVVLKTASEISGEIVVEDVKVEDEESENEKSYWHRRLVFLSSQNCIQSEVRLRAGSGSKKKKKGQRKSMVVCRDFLAFEFHRAMVASLFLLPAWQALDGKSEGGQEQLRVMLVGLGGGSLGSYILQTMPEVCLEVVELDPCLVEIAESHFGFPSQHTNSRLKVRTDDGLAVLKEMDIGRYHAIIIDVDSKDTGGEVLAPGQDFLSPDFLKHLRQNVCAEGGGVIMNMACTTEGRQKEEAAKLENVFPCAVSISLESDGDANAIATGIRVDESSVTATGLVAQAKRVLTGKKGDNKYGSLLDYIENCVVAGRE